MQILGVNNTNNNLCFGTRVLVRPGTKEIIEKSKVKKEIFKQIENLKKNGIDDFLILSHNETKEAKPYINAEIVEFIDNNCYMNIHTYSSSLEEKQDETIDNYLDIDKLYKASKEKMTKTGIITKQIFATFIHEYQEM